MENKDERIKKLEQEIIKLDKEQDNFVTLLEDELFNKEVQLKQNFEEHEKIKVSFLERLSVVSGVIAPLSLLLLNLDFVYKPFVLISFSIFLINILIIQFFIHMYLNIKQRENIKKFFKLSDYSCLIFKHKLEKRISKRVILYSDILKKHEEVRNDKKILTTTYGDVNQYVRIILILLVFSISVIILSLVWESIVSLMMVNFNI